MVATTMIFIGKIYIVKIVNSPLNNLWITCLHLSFQTNTGVLPILNTIIGVEID